MNLLILEHSHSLPFNFCLWKRCLPKRPEGWLRFLSKIASLWSQHFFQNQKAPFSGGRANCGSRDSQMGVKTQPATSTPSHVKLTATLLGMKPC